MGILDSARAAASSGCRSVAFTYNDPIIFLEYAVDVADACREAGVKSVAVTAGYVDPEPRREFQRKQRIGKLRAPVGLAGIEGLLPAQVVEVDAHGGRLAVARATADVHDAALALGLYQWEQLIYQHEMPEEVDGKVQAQANEQTESASCQLGRWH